MRGLRRHEIFLRWVEKRKNYEKKDFRSEIENKNLRYRNYYYMCVPYK